MFGATLCPVYALHSLSSQTITCRAVVNRATSHLAVWVRGGLHCKHFPGAFVILLGVTFCLFYQVYSFSLSSALFSLSTLLIFLYFFFTHFFFPRVLIILLWVTFSSFYQLYSFSLSTALFSLSILLFFLYFFFIHFSLPRVLVFLLWVTFPSVYPLHSSSL